MMSDFYRKCGKRSFDVVCAILLLAATFPIQIALYFAVRAALGSPVFFRQQRPGWKGKEFGLIKFRSMLDLRNEQGQSLSDSDRLTRFGRLLRATSLDELPELWNVLKGEMSLVGPRPLMPRYLPYYSKEEMRRHDVRPGVTGWSQIRGRNAVTWPERFRDDLWYVDHLSFMLDLKILFLTVWKVLRRDGINHQPGRPMPAFDEFARAEGRQPRAELGDAECGVTRTAQERIE